MAFPEFFARIPGLTLRDPLAELLGAAEGGLIDYRFTDAVRLAGHSCPTVAGAWLMTTRALRALYGEETPERGALRVDLSEEVDAGVSGVIASVATLLTGAAGKGGFKGLGGRHARRKLLNFGVAGAGELRLTRLDNGRSACCRLNLACIPPAPAIGRLLPEILAGNATDDERRSFAEAWQGRVEKILIDHHDDPDLVAIELFNNSI